MIGVMVFCLAELPGYATSDATSISTSVIPKSKRLVCYGNSQSTTYDAPPPYTSDNSNIQLTGEYWCTEPGTASCNPNTIPIGVITSTITTYGILHCIPKLAGGCFNICQYFYACEFRYEFKCQTVCAKNVITPSPLTNCKWET